MNIKSDMNPREVAQSYDKITHLWQADAFDMRNGIKQHQRALNIKPHGQLALDIGCGPTNRISELIAGAGYRVEGLDLSEAMLAIARESRPQQKFFHADIVTWTFPQSYDFITAWDSLWHIPLDSIEAVLTKIIAHLTPGGIFIFSFGATEGLEEHTNEAMGVPMYYSSLGTMGYLKFFAEQPVQCIHLEQENFPDKHAYMILQKNSVE